MDVRLNQILQSAEKYIRDRGELKDLKGSTPPTATPLAPEPDFAVSLRAQYQSIQTRLGDLQKQLSREQARMSLLEDSGTDVSTLREALFENEALFPEVESNSFEKDKILLATQSSVRSLLAELKKKEVEGENVFSLGMIVAPGDFTPSASFAVASTLKPISENVVKRLLGG